MQMDIDSSVTGKGVLSKPSAWMLCRVQMLFHSTKLLLTADLKLFYLCFLNYENFASCAASKGTY